MRSGKISKQFVVTCAICSGTYVWHGDEEKAPAALKEGGWGLTKELGWVCLNCQQNSEPLRKLLPESTIVKNQPIEE